MISYRVMVPEDLGEVKQLHEDWFPIRYNEDFYESIAHGTSFGPGGPVHCIVAVWIDGMLNEEQRCNQKGEIIGAVSAQIQPLSTVSDGGLPRPTDHGAWEGALYILTLGTDKKFRRQGIGQELVARVIQFAESDPSCMAAFLHVITYNTAAINFYKSNGFRIAKEIPDYYYICKKNYSCFLCIRYLNGARDPSSESKLWIKSFLDSIGYFFGFLRRVITMPGSQKLKKDEPAQIDTPTNAYSDAA